MIDRDRVIDDLEKLQHSFNRRPCIGDAITLLKADQAYLLGVMYALQLIVDDADLYGEPIAGDEVRRLIDQMRNVSLRWGPEEVTDDAEWLLGMLRAW